MSNPEHTPLRADVRNRMIAFLPRLRRFCIAVAGSVDAGDDLVQSTVQRAMERIDQWQDGTSLESWMYRIARNIHIDAMRSKATRGVAVDMDAVGDLAGDDGVAIVEGRSDLAAARDALASLPDEQRTLIALVVLEGRSYKEAAEVLEIPIGTVMSRIARARKAMEQHINRLAG